MPRPLTTCASFHPRFTASCTPVWRPWPSSGACTCAASPGDPGGTMDPVVGPADGDKCLAEIAQARFGRGSDVLFGHHDSNRSPIHIDHPAVADLVLHPVITLRL